MTFQRDHSRRGMPAVAGATSFAPRGVGGAALVWVAQDSFNTPECRSEITQGVFGSLGHFLRCVLEGRSPDIGSLEFARHITELHDAAILSDGQPVEVGAQ